MVSSRQLRNVKDGPCRRTLPARRLASLRACALRLGPGPERFPLRSLSPLRTFVLPPAIRPGFQSRRPQPRKRRQNPRRSLPRPPRARDASTARSPRSGCPPRPASGERVSCAPPACAPLSALVPSSSRSTSFWLKLFSRPALLSFASRSSPYLYPPPPQVYHQPPLRSFEHKTQKTQPVPVKRCKRASHVQTDLVWNRADVPRSHAKNLSSSSRANAAHPHD